MDALMARVIALSRHDGVLADWVDRFGGPLSPAAFDRSCELFAVEGVDGAIAYRRAPGGYAVALGDPICHPRDAVRLVVPFCDAFRHALFAAASGPVSTLAVELGFASIEFGEELTIDPRAGTPHGRRGHGLRRKLNHARHVGVCVEEYVPARHRDGALEGVLQQTVDIWLAGRRGLQVYVAQIDLFRPGARCRWFYATQQRQVVGLMTVVHLGAQDGWLLEHLLAVPTAPTGTSELLVMDGLAQLGQEGCAAANFGMSTASALGAIDGLSRTSTWLSRHFFAWAQKHLQIDSVGEFRRKFGAVRARPSYLLFHPPSVGLRELYALLRALNVWPPVRRRADASRDVVELGDVEPALVPVPVPVREP
jgi:lysylphosphatidylglycerol synthetase-like protein (DUF2156 family)